MTAKLEKLWHRHKPPGEDRAMAAIMCYQVSAEMCRDSTG